MKTLKEPYSDDQFYEIVTSLLEGILSSLSTQIAIIDENGFIAAVNRSWNQYFIDSEKSIFFGVGINFFENCSLSINQGDRIALEILAGAKEVIHGKRPDFYIEYPNHLSDQKQWFSLRILKFGNSEPVLVLAIDNITEKMLAQEQLKIQNKELTKINAELDRFVYSASHDLRAPLTTILGLVNLIKTESKEPTIVHYASLIRTSVQLLDAITKNILDYSKNNHILTEISHISLAKTVKRLYDSMNWIQGLAPDATHSPTAHVTLEMDIDEKIPFFSDFPRIEIVIENLISNAIKFQDITKPNRFIRVIGKMDKDFLILRFSDNGAGIPPEYHERIFEMFFRLASKISGSGIGLYVVNEIVTRLNGSISLESELGRGTDILIKIPNLINESQLNPILEQ